jgi:hypothetical protein
MTKMNPVLQSPDQLKNSIVPFDIKDPSPVIMQLTQMLIETAQNISSMNEVLSGQMPDRELPAQTMLMMIEESTKNAAAIYKRIKTSITKELNIICRILYQNNNQDHYQQTLSDDQANLLADFDLTSMTVNANSDKESCSAGERIMKWKIINDMLLNNPAYAPLLSTKELLIRFFKDLNIDDTENLVVQPSPPQPNFDQQMEQQRIDIQRQKEVNKTQYQAVKALEQRDLIASQVAKNEADAAKSLAVSTTEAIATAQAIYDHTVNGITPNTPPPAPTQPQAPTGDVNNVPGQ